MIVFIGEGNVAGSHRQSREKAYKTLGENDEQCPDWGETGTLHANLHLGFEWLRENRDSTTATVLHLL